MYRIHRAVHWASLDAYIRSLSPAAWFRAGQGITVTGAGVSQWDDQSGNGRHLLQGTDAARPIDLPFSGTRYLYLPGVAGNHASTPDSAAVSVTGSIEIIVRAKQDDWTPTGYSILVAKYNAATAQDAYGFLVDTGSTGKLIFLHTNGTTSTAVLSSVSPGLTDGTAYWLRVTWNQSTGATNFYKAADSSSIPTSWTQVGSADVSGPTSALNDGNVQVSIGGHGGSSNTRAGRIYRAIIKNGINGTTVADFNPADASDGATSFASSATGETWTINRSGSLPAYIVGMAGAMGNGSSHYLRASFTSDQPITDYLVCRPLSWTASDQLIGGVSANAGAIEQSGSTPAVVLYDGSAVASNTNLALNARAVVCAVHNGANGVLRVNNTTETTGNSGSGNPGGITLFGNNTPSGFANAIGYELVRFHAAHDLATRARIIAGLMARHGVAG